MTGGPLRVAVSRLSSAGDLPLPDYATAMSAGMDLRAALSEPLEITPGGRALVPTGLAIALPAGYEAQIRPRSGLALKHGITVLNAPGTVDADYRGEISVVLANFGSESFTVTRGMRIAQMIVAPFAQVSWVVVESAAALPESGRGAGGYAGPLSQPSSSFVGCSVFSKSPPFSLLLSCCNSSMSRTSHRNPGASGRPPCCSFCVAQFWPTSNSVIFSGLPCNYCCLPLLTSASEDDGRSSALSGSRRCSPCGPSSGNGSAILERG